MSVRPSPFRTALVGVALATLLTGCAGTDSPESTGGSPTSTPTSAEPTSSAPSPSESAPAGQRIEVTVTGGQVSGDTGRVPVPAGEQVTLVVTSDAADEVHVHGYDETAALEPGQPAELTFTADIPGVFEVELHDAGTVLLTLQVG